MTPLENIRLAERFASGKHSNVLYLLVSDEERESFTTSASGDCDYVTKYNSNMWRHRRKYSHFVDVSSHPENDAEDASVIDNCMDVDSTDATVPDATRVDAAVADAAVEDVEMTDLEAEKTDSSDDKKAVEDPVVKEDPAAAEVEPTKAESKADGDVVAAVAEVQDVEVKTSESSSRCARYKNFFCPLVDAPSKIS
jgi:hypothetical protein